MGDTADVATKVTDRCVDHSDLTEAATSGGYSESGALSSNGGVVIHLAWFMEIVTVNLEENTFIVQCGARWEFVDNDAQKFG